MSEEGKFCRDCSHVIGIRTNTQDWERWKCGKTREGFNLVSGIAIANFCQSARTNPDSCGPEGKWYETYTRPNLYNLESVGDPPPIRSIGGVNPVDITALRESVKKKMGKVTDKDLDNL